MQIGGIGPEQPPPTPPPGDPGGWDAAMEAQSRNPAGGGRLPEADLNLVRQWLVEGGSLRQIGTALSLWPASVQGAQARLGKQFGIEGTSGWAPVLKDWLTTGELTRQEIAGAILNLTTKPDSGPPAAWNALLTAMAKAGTPPSELAELAWAVRCGPLGLNTAERQVVRLICSGMDTAEVTAAMGRSLDNIKNLRRQIMDKFVGFESRQGQDIHTRIIAGAHFLQVLPPDCDPRAVQVAQLHTQAHTLGRLLTVQQAEFLLDMLQGEPLETLDDRYGGNINLLAFKLSVQLDLTGVWQAGTGIPVMVTRARELGLSDPDDTSAEPIRAAERAEPGAQPPGPGRVLALASDRGLLITPLQAGILHDLSMHRPLREIMAEHGEALTATMDGLGVTLGVVASWRSGRSVQAFVDMAEAEGLIESRPWPDRARLPQQFAALMHERFGLGTEKLAALDALAAGPVSGDAKAALARMADAAGQDRDQVRAMVVDMALRLCPSLPNGTMERVVSALHQWMEARAFDENTPERTIQAACQTQLSQRQLATLYSVSSPSEARELTGYSGTYAVSVYRGLLAIEKRVGIPATYTEAALLVRPVLDAALAREIVARV